MVETGGLENRFTRKGNGGSNPSPSAINSAYRVKKSPRSRLFEFLSSKRQIRFATASAARMARCIMVKVGLALPEDGKTEALAILRFSIR